MVRIRQGTAADLPVVRSILSAARLPTEDLETAAALTFWIAENEDAPYGVIGCERYGDVALLRSLAIDPGHQQQGIARALVVALEASARTKGVSQLVLLTETAQQFFEKLGYRVAHRDAVPASVKQAAEFDALCPSTAICMTKELQAKGTG